MVKVQFKKFYNDVKLPVYAGEHEAGMDIYSREMRTLEQGEPHMFKVGFGTHIPQGHVAFIKDRSSLGKRGITVLGGVIDCTYRGEWGILLVNTSDKEYLIHPGDKIAQAVFLPLEHAEIEEVDDLEDSKRGDGGFGSTGR